MHPYYAPESLKTSIPHREELYAAMQDGSILNQGAFQLDLGSQFRGTAVIENKGSLYCPAFCFLDLSRITGNSPVRN